MDEDPENWAEVHGFQSPGEHREVEAWLVALEAPFAGLFARVRE